MDCCCCVKCDAKPKEDPEQQQQQVGPEYTEQDPSASNKGSADAYSRFTLAYLLENYYAPCLTQWWSAALVVGIFGALIVLATATFAGSMPALIMDPALNVPLALIWCNLVAEVSTSYP